MVTSRKKTPAFSAVLTHKQSASANDVIKFNKVYTNIGRGYNPSTGIFTAPIAGVYQFSAVVMSDKGQYLIASLYHNATRVSSVHIKTISFQTGALGMVLDLKKGDQIAVKSGGRYTIHSDIMNYCSFSGFVISQ